MDVKPIPFEVSAENTMMIIVALFDGNFITLRIQIQKFVECFPATKLLFVVDMVGHIIPGLLFDF